MLTPSQPSWAFVTKTISIEWLPDYFFFAKQARPDIQVAVAFLCTWVSEPIKQDYGKLATVIKYICETIHLPLLIGWNKSGVLTLSVDAAFSVHRDIQSHTGAALTMGKGTVLLLSLKQKINTKSSTEAELVGVDDAMNFVVWSKLFFDWQFKDYNSSTPTSQLCKMNVLLQDNTSAIQLKQYGKRSSSKQTRHISIRYFYVTDKLQDKTLTTISYCLTKEIVSNYLSKSLQRSLFPSPSKRHNGYYWTRWSQDLQCIQVAPGTQETKWMNAFPLFFYLILCFIFKSLFFDWPTSLISALWLAECVGIFIFHFYLRGPQMPPRNYLKGVLTILSKQIVLSH